MIITKHAIDFDFATALNGLSVGTENPDEIRETLLNAIGNLPPYSPVLSSTGNYKTLKDFKFSFEYFLPSRDVNENIDESVKSDIKQLLIDAYMTQRHFVRIMMCGIMFAVVNSWDGTAEGLKVVESALQTVEDALFYPAEKE